MAEHELGLTRADRWLIWVGFPLVGLAAGWGLPVLARWLLRLPWVPFGGPVRLIAALDGHGRRHGAAAAAGRHHAHGAAGRGHRRVRRRAAPVVRERLEGAGDARVGRAFRAHGYPWLERDPYADLFRRWVPDLPDLPGSVNAVLAARAVALTNKSLTDAAELRDEVQRYTVRDDGTTQHWRPLVRS